MASAAERLQELDKWLRNGSLKKACQEELLGTELVQVMNTINSGAVRATLDKIESALDLAGDPEKSALAEEVERITRASTSLLEAQEPRELQDWSRFRWDDVRDATTKSAKVLRESWARRCEAAFWQESQLASVLEAILPAVAKEMSENASAGKKLGAAFPPSDEARREFDLRVKLSGARKTKLLEGGANEELVAFLLLVAENKATLADLSQAVFQWLKKNKALESVKLTL